MLDLRPICEHCSKPLPPESIEAMICSFECTFCRDCAAGVFHNVCPNCGGGFSGRPVRPSKNWKGDNFLGNSPASTEVKHRPVNLSQHERFASEVKLVPPEER